MAANKCIPNMMPTATGLSGCDQPNKGSLQIAVWEGLADLYDLVSVEFVCYVDGRFFVMNGAYS
jgi:hypothetical protein